MKPPTQHRSFRSLILFIAVTGLVSPAAVRAAEPAAPPFSGEKSTWRDGFDRYDYSMDDATLAITPVKAPAGEGFGIDKNLKDGKRRCVVIAPKQAAPGNPWSWRGCYWDHQPQTEVELLHRGFHIAYIAPDPGRQGKQWDAWYEFLTEQHGLSRKPAFIGMSKGGVNEYNWAVAHPDKVACIYADNPAIYPEDYARLEELAKHDIPLLNICGTLDFLYQSGKHSLAIESRYHEFGGRITMMIKDGTAHHPHSLVNAKPIADWIERNMSVSAPPDFIDQTFVKSYYYGLEDSYVYLPEEKTYMTCRGPGFTECYERYDGITPSQWGIKGLEIIVPKKAAPGLPWVFRADRIGRDALVDQALLAKGYHIVTVPLPGQTGITQKDWDTAYKFMTDHGFSKKPVMEGTASAAGEAFAWAIQNPGQVSCIFAENPVLRSLLLPKTELLDSLEPLAKAGVPLILDCGSKDPWFNDQAKVIEKRYKALGGQVEVIVKEGDGHFPLQPREPQRVVDFIASHQG